MGNYLKLCTIKTFQVIVFIVQSFKKNVFKHLSRFEIESENKERNL